MLAQQYRTCVERHWIHRQRWRFCHQNDGCVAYKIARKDTTRNTVQKPTTSDRFCFRAEAFTYLMESIRSPVSKIEHVQFCAPSDAAALDGSRTA